MKIVSINLMIRHSGFLLAQHNWLHPVSSRSCVAERREPGNCFDFGRMSDRPDRRSPHPRPHAGDQIEVEQK